MDTFVLIFFPHKNIDWKSDKRLVEFLNESVKKDGKGRHIYAHMQFTLGNPFKESKLKNRNIFFL